MSSLHTNAGQSTRSVAGHSVPTGDVTVCQVRNHKQQIQVRVLVPGPVLVTLTLTAPATKGFRPYHHVAQWIAHGI